MRAQIESRSALVSALGLIVGLSAGGWFPSAAFLLVLLSLVSTLRARAIAILSFTVGVILWPGLPPTSNFTEREVREEFTVSSMPRMSKVGQISEIENITGRYRILVKEGEISLGDRILIHGKLKGVSEVQEPYFSAKGILGSITISKAEDIQILQQGPGIFRVGMQWRKSFLDFTERSLSPQVANMVDALCFNVDGELPDEMRDNLQRTGTIHIISASGLHVFLFSVALQFLLAFLPLPRWAQFLLLICILMLYATAAGFRPPVVRAAFMGVAYMGSEFVRRVPDSLSSLSLVAIGYLLWKPLTLLDIGFQLSFVAVFALSYFRTFEISSPQGLVSVLKSRISHTLWQSVVATVATAPLVAYHFGMVSVVAIVANLLIAAAILPVMVGSVLAWLFSFVLPTVAAGILSIFVSPFVGWISGVVSSLGEVSFASIEIPAFHALWLVPVYLAMVTLWRPRVRPA